MKKLLLGSIVLLGFNLVIILTQMSCKKEAMAQADNTSNSSNSAKPLNLILYAKKSGAEIWLANIDGSNQRKVPVPNDIHVSESRLSADGKTVIFEGWYDTPNKNAGIYSCSLDGSNLKKLINDNNEDILLMGAY
ncbi:Tol biopolymer transport system component [Chitinophaga terrae (ex Kim and Jung 2007)]|uniref:hypothetical protein n=1 Tax=Chitinophaga terrae (ex Kim and Jung 2007) TaxID=408074 RepID=UPI002788659D|nr:hypothetical protein [Chitinophaga terrae (ex Kim and Jung 2007)]MDQ0110524.1 Tol biopolymer transport system component [Chitinophaga terrae (ex Kim and Jung 2007)]